MSKKTYTVIEAAQYLGERLRKTMSRKAVQTLIRRGRFPNAYNDMPNNPRRGFSRIPQDDLDNYIEHGKRPGRPRKHEEK